MLRPYVVALTLAFVPTKVTHAVDGIVGPGADWPAYYDIPAQPLASAVEAFGRRRAGSDYYIGHRAWHGCKKTIVGPVVGWFTRKEAWFKLTESICADAGVVFEDPEGQVYMIDHPWVAERAVASRLRTIGCSCQPAIVVEFYLQPAAVSVDAGAMPSVAERSVAVAADRLQLETTTVTGHRELPKVLFIVPWKKSEPAALPTEPFNTLLDEVLAPLDRDVFRRELEYYDALSSRSTKRAEGAR